MVPINMTIQAVDELTNSAPMQVDALVYKIGEITCDFSNNYLDDGDQTHWLMLKEAQILLALVRAYPNPVKPIELHQNIWQSGPLNESLINRVIINLREKLNDLEEEIIRKVPEFGYVLTMVPKPVIPNAAFAKPGNETYDDIYHHPKTTADLSVFKPIAIYSLIPIMMAVAFQMGFYFYDRLSGFNDTVHWVKLSNRITDSEMASLKRDYSGEETLFIDKTREGDLVVCNLQPGNKGIACTTK